MPKSDLEVVVVGGGAAGVAAARHLHDAGVDCLIIEARDRLGGRAWTTESDGYPIDLGCGWLHSANRNPWREIAEAQGHTIDKTPPPWTRPSLPIGFSPAEQKAFVAALRAFWARLGDFPEEGEDVSASTLLEPGNRWNALIGAVATFLSGTELPGFSARDFSRYDDTGVNWRVVEGYGATIASHARQVPVRLGCAVRSIDHRGRYLAIETTDGTLEAKAAIVTLPSNLIAEQAIRFTPALPQKVEAAAGLPLGLADKLFLSLTDAEEFDADTRLFGHTERTGTGAYHFRPFGRPMIEAYFGGSLADEIELGGERAFHDFALAELTRLLGSSFARRVRPVASYSWRSDPLARGSYSYAQPGKAECRKLLASPVDDRLFFAGEACSEGDYSTAHGAYQTGIDAAKLALRSVRHSAR